jgi:TatD DNase family protein
MTADAPYVDIHTHHSVAAGDTITLRSLFAQKIDEQHIASGFFSIGVHPWHAAAVTFEDVRVHMQELLRRPECLAVGEVGLDRAFAVNLDLQMNLFLQQLECATELHMPMVLHCVRAYADLMGVRKNSPHDQAWIVHAFHGNADVASQLIRHEMYLSFGSSIVEKSDKLCHVLTEIPLHRLFLETDEAEMPVSRVYAAASDILGIPVTRLRSILFENFQNCFGVEI